MGVTLVSSTTWNDTQFFNSATLEWASCPTNYLKYSDGLSCYCPRHRIKEGVPKPQTCTDCTTGQAANYIQDTCLTWDTSTTSCICAADEYLQEYDNSGTSQLRWVACPKGYFSAVSTDPVYYWEEWPLEGQIASGGTWAWDTANGEIAVGRFCVNSTDYNDITGTYNPSTSYSVSYDPVAAGSGLSTATVSTSDTFNTLLPQSLYECLKFRNDDQCQILANLWVYQMYNENEAPCSAFRFLLNNITTVQNDYYDSGWRQNIPWLYYNGRWYLIFEWFKISVFFLYELIQNHTIFKT